MISRPFGSRKASAGDGSGAGSSAVHPTDVHPTDVDRTAVAQPAASTPADPSPAAGADPRRPAPKGRPTPKRRDRERERGLHTGPVTAPTTRKEAKERRKAAEATMTPEEKKANRARLKDEREERRRLMMEGDDRYVLSRDRGDVRRFARDWVDVHRRLVNWFMPIALVVVVLTLLPYAALQRYGTLVFFVLMIVLIVDGALVGRSVNREVRQRFPDSEDHGFGLGWYAAMRATQPRRLRTPTPRRRPGDTI